MNQLFGGGVSTPPRLATAEIIKPAFNPLTIPIPSYLSPFSNGSDFYISQSIRVWYAINQSTIIGTLKTKSLLPSLYKREELPLFAKGARGDFLKQMSSL